MTEGPVPGGVVNRVTAILEMNRGPLGIRAVNGDPPNCAAGAFHERGATKLGLAVGPHGQSRWRFCPHLAMAT